MAGKEGVYFQGSVLCRILYLFSGYCLVRLLATMNEVHLASLHTLAFQAGVMMDVVCAMGSILPAYHTSYHYAKAVFLSFIEQAGR